MEVTIKKHGDGSMQVWGHREKGKGNSSGEHYRAMKGTSVSRGVKRNMVIALSSEL